MIIYLLLNTDQKLKEKKEMQSSENSNEKGESTNSKFNEMKLSNNTLRKLFLF